MEKNKQTKQSFSDNLGGINIGALFGIEGLVDNSASTIGGLGKGPGNTTGVGGNVPITSLMPLVDPTYRSGFDYARSIAGGMPMSQVIAPGVSYSPKQPMGYTQEQLNTAIGITPVEPPPPTGPTYKEGIEDMIRIPPSERGVTIPVDRKMPPLRDLFGGSPTQMPLPIPDYDPRDIDIDAIRQKIAESGIDFTNLFGLPKYETPDLSEFVRKEDVSSFIPEVPAGREFSIEDIRSGLDLPDFSKFARQEDIPTIPTREDFLSIAREGIDIPMPQQPDVSKFVTQEDINRAIAGIDIPTYQAPDLSGLDTRLADLEKGLLDLREPTGGRFSISQPRPMGLF
jgi:hypothetical protein